jgi:uncharacterized protein with PIN domain
MSEKTEKLSQLLEQLIKNQDETSKRLESLEKNGSTTSHKHQDTELIDPVEHLKRCPHCKSRAKELLKAEFEAEKPKEPKTEVPPETSKYVCSSCGHGVELTDKECKTCGGQKARERK